MKTPMLPRADVVPVGGLRVLHVVHALQAGGMENGVVNLAHGLLERGMVHDVCAVTTAGGFAQRLPVESAVYELNKGDGFSLKNGRQLRGLIKKTEADVVHAHNFSGLIYSSVALVGSAVPLLMGDHAQLWGWEKKWHRLLLRKVLYRLCCRSVHTVSEGVRQELLGYGIASPKKIVALPNGVDTERFQPRSGGDAKARLGLPERSFVIGMAARLVFCKRHDLLLEAFGRLAAKYGEVHLVMAGNEGEATKAVHEAMKVHAYRERIHWLGMRDDMPQVYAAMDLLALPSESEGMSNVCLEAMACGVPVAVSDVCGANEIVVDGETGVVGQMQDAAALAMVLEGCVADRERLRGWGRAARRHVERNFSITRMMDRYEKLYRSLCEGKGAE